MRCLRAALPAYRLAEFMSSFSSAGQSELKYGAARFIRLCPQPTPMGIDDRPANRQPHPYSAGFRGVESLENALEMFRINARPRIAHCHEDAICLALLRADRQLSWPLLNRPHCFDRIQNQVQDDLLQLNTIPLNRKRPLRKVGI